MLSRPDFASALRGYDPRVLHAHAATATSLRTLLTSLRAEPRRRVSRDGPAATLASAAAAVQPLATLQAAVRSGGRAVGQLYLWCSRVLSEAQALEAEDRLEEARAEESDALAGVLARAHDALERLERKSADLASSASVPRPGQR